MEPDSIRVADVKIEMVINRLVDLMADLDDVAVSGPWGPLLAEAGAGSPARPAAGPDPDPWSRAERLVGLWRDELAPWPPRPNWFDLFVLRQLTRLVPQPLPPVETPVRFLRSLAMTATQNAERRGLDGGAAFLRQLARGWCGNEIIIPPLRWPRPLGGEPRPPRPEESMALGASLIRAAAALTEPGLKTAAEAAGREILAHGMREFG